MEWSRNNHDHEPGGRLDKKARRGLVPYWARDIKVGFANIIAKAERIENRPAFHEAFQRRRYLVPVDNFYEWKKTATGKQPYAKPRPSLRAEIAEWNHRWLYARPIGAILVIDDVAKRGYHMGEAIKALRSLGISAAGIAWISADSATIRRPDWRDER